jgi:membrane-associated phospholipid phosphatase
MTRPRTALAVSVGLAAVVVYAAMWVGYLQGWGWLRALDATLLNAGHGEGVRHPWWVPFFRGVSFALDPVLRVLGTVLAAYALVRRNLRAALMLLCCATLSGFVTLGAKSLVNRPRPTTMLTFEPSTSFPSGHSLEGTAVLLALLIVFAPMLSRSAARIATAVTALCVLLVGAARVCLNVHYPSDVLAGWSLGYLLFLFCLLMFRPRRALITRQ